MNATPQALPGTERLPTEPDSAPVAARSYRHLAILLVLLAAGAALRFGLWLWFADLPPRIWDEVDYNTLACNLVTHHEFAYQPGTPATLRPPLYPAVVAVLYRLFGLENYQAVRLFQALLSLATVLLLYRLGTAVGSPRVALWLAGLSCFYPSFLGFNNLLLTEVLFTFLLCAFCLVLIRALQRDSLGLLGTAGVLLGLTALTRSVVWLLPPVLVCFLLPAFRGSLARRALAALVFTASFAVTIAPWAARNTRVEKTFIAIDTMGGRNFMMGNYRYTPLYRSWEAVDIPGEQSWIHEVLAANPSAQPRTQGQIDKLALRQGLKFVAVNPGLTLQRDVVKFFDFWGLERELVSGAASGFFGPISRPVLVALAVLIFGSYVFALFAGVFGIFLAPPADRRVHLFLLLVIAFICGMHTLVFGHSRYHLPLMPLVLLYAAAALVRRREIWARRRSPLFWAACSLCLVFVGGWLWSFLALDGERLLNLLRSGT
jgi:4-amino-4-deoxy-L-arabinose transferase-like glycosyltransferase